MRVLVVMAVATVAGCRPPLPHSPAFPDAPLELRDESDRDQAIDELWVLPPGAERSALRGRVATAIARRVGDALEDDRPFVAEQLVFELASLWERDPQALGAELGEQAGLLERMRAAFAKSGASEPVLATLVMLAEIEPARRTARLAELDEVLGFADELATAEDGPDAARAQPIAELQPVALALPLPWLVDRYVKLLEDRQRVVGALLVSQGASMQLVRAHQDILATGHRIANVLARADRVPEIARHVQVEGIGYDRELAIRAQLVADQPSADAYVELARTLRNDTHAPDSNAAFAICLAGLAKFPTDAALLAAAAEDAATLGRVDQPIALYEAALAGTAPPVGAAAGRGQAPTVEPQGELDAVLALKLGRLYAQRIARLAFGGRPGAATTAWHDLARFTDVAARKSPHEVWAQVTASAQTALGRGLVSQGRIEEAERALVAALGRAPTIDAYEALVTIDFKTNRFSDAARYAHAGLELLGDTTGDRYRRAKLERLAADTLRAAGNPGDAAKLYLETLHTWDSIGEDRNLPRAIAAERKLEAGRAVWALGRADDAVGLVLRGVDVDPDSAAVCSEAVALLLELGRYGDALDAFRRGLGSPDVAELYKVYMSLWIVAEGRRQGRPRDRLAWDYLASRHGELWYEQLAEAATGRREFAALVAGATTAPRKAEVAFYGAVLALDPEAATPAGLRKKLGEVVAAGLVMDAEYDLARLYLGTR